MANPKVTQATLRARQMMIGGLLGGHLAGGLVIAGGFLLDGFDGGITAVLGFAAVVIFYSIGQALEVVASELEPMQGLGLVLVSYAVRTIGIAAGLWTLLELPQVVPHIRDGWLLLSVVVTVIAWVSGVVLVASRQRVPIYDREYLPPENS